jgi:hypothetical protein
MPPLITYILLFCITLCGLIFLVELLVSHSLGRFALEGGILALIVIVLRLTTGFPASRESFGGISPAPAIGVMFIGVVLGIAARYFFFLRGKFSWRSLVKPLCISPIVMLPLISSVQGVQNLESIQMISFAFLSFQNGFFWEVVLEHAKAKA